MENASKALIMAGGLLISLMVASLLVYVFNNFGEHAREVTERVNERHLTAANEEFLQYEGSDENTIYDIAYEYALSDEVTISVNIKNVEHFNYWLGALPYYDNVQKEGIVLAG